ncbi:MAG: hypothetical protein ACRCU5_04900 [Rhizobiaceae bacterium]
MHKPESLVHSLVIYEWGSDLSLRQIYDVFESFFSNFEHKPDFVDISTHDKNYTYKYSYFYKREVVKKPIEWVGLGYTWRREEGVMSSYTVYCTCCIDRPKVLAFYVDEIAMPKAKGFLTEWSEEVTTLLRPVYGYINTMAYGLQPHWYVRGYSFSVPNFEDEDRRRIEFGYVFPLKDRNLDRRFRDIYPLNLISEGHLSLDVQGASLQNWIGKGGRGVLKRIGDVTWQWQLEPSEIEKVRGVLLGCGHLIVPI